MTLRFAFLCFVLLGYGPATQAAQDFDAYGPTADLPDIAISMITAQGSTLLLPANKTGLLPVVILLPYTGGTAQDLLNSYYPDSLLQQADELSFAVLIPAVRASAHDYASVSAWDATLARYDSELAADVDELVSEYDADPERIVLAGSSMGGDLAWAMTQRDPDRYAGAIVMGSRASYRTQQGLDRLAEQKARFYMFMGTRETRSRLRGMRSALAALDTAGIAYKYMRAPGGHVPAPVQQFNEAIRFVLKY